MLLGAAFLAAPPMGTDLAAQVARAAFVERHGYLPIDLGWYGGVNQFGYSLLTAGLGATLGVPVLGVLAALVGTAAFGWLLARHRAPRPVLGGVLGAVVLVGNLVSGRITFAVGLALGLLALCAISAERPGRLLRLALAALLAATATWASPVAGLFVGLAGGAILLAGLRRADPPPARATDAHQDDADQDDAHPADADQDDAHPADVDRAGMGRPAGQPAGSPGRRLVGGWWSDRPLAESLVLCLAPALALVPMALLFGNGGTQPFSVESMKANVALAVVVLLVLPRRLRVLRIGALLTVLLLVAAYHLPSPIGSNSLRLTMLFAVPLVAAFAVLPPRLGRGGARSPVWLAALLAALVWWQPPVMLDDLGRAGSVETSARFYQPLVDELARRQPVGRIEVVPLRDHWESTYLPPEVPLARGWERQVDSDRNAIFYAGELTADRYAEWLRREAVSHVALAPDSPPDRWGRTEAALIKGDLPYLREVWRDPTWRLYAVVDPTPLVAAPGRLLSADQAAVRFTVDTPGEVTVRVRWSRWLSLSGPAGCVAPGDASSVTVRAPTTGEYELSSALRPTGHCRPAHP
ncbi:hypothetical protein [Micromonospora yangpuensis]|uniref:hypothetical protein n=1 Tax=Micromonospora yangpuensis TaxID=683228 RepID=UPI000B89DE7E|nr:hypothetical protein [Micromonospora yangpuensis]